MMSPSQLSWLQGCLFLFLGVVGGVAGGYGLNRCQIRRTDRGTSHGELSSIRVESQIATTPFDDAQSSGSDEEARSPSNLLNPGEAMALTGSPRCPDRNRLPSKSRRRPRRLLKLSAKSRKTSHFLEFVAQAEMPNLARIETANSTSVADETPSPMSSPTAGLLQPSEGEGEALSPSHPVGEALALPEDPSCPDPKRYRSNSCRRMNSPEDRTKSPFEKFKEEDESRNVVRPEPANMIVADSFSTSMASTTAVQHRPPSRHFVPRPSREFLLVDHAQVSLFDGLRRRTRTWYTGIRYIIERGKWVAEMSPQNSKNTYSFGDFESDLQAACAVDAAYFYYERPHQTNILHSSPAMLAMLPPMPAGLNDKDKLVFVRDKAKRLAKYAADNLAGVNPSVDRKNQ